MKMVRTVLRCQCLTVFSVCFLVLCSLAQEVEGNGKNGSAVFSPADYLEISVAVTPRLGVNTYGFYLGNVRASIGLLEIPVTLQRHFSIAPSYLFVNVPPAGLSLLTGESPSRSYHENQFRLAGTASGVFHGFTLADRNMYVRRYTPTGDINRYRNRVFAAHSLAFGSYRVTPFVFDEIYHDFAPGNWLRRNWIVGAVDMPLNRYITFQPSYIRQDDQFLRSVNFLGIGLIVKTKRLFEGKARVDRAATAGDDKGLISAD